MQTAITGAYCPQLAQPLRLPAFPVSDLTYSLTPTGVLVTHNGLLVAWIYGGHAGHKHSIHPICHFYDVAFPTLTTDDQHRITGVMLDSDSFDTLEAAIAFVHATFGGAE